MSLSPQDRVQKVISRKGAIFRPIIPQEEDSIAAVKRVAQCSSGKEAFTPAALAENEMTAGGRLADCEALVAQPRTAGSICLCSASCRTL